MTFAHPDLLVLAVLAPVVIAALGLLEDWRRRVLVARLGEVALVQRMMASASPWRRWLKRGLFAGGLAAIAIATARPQQAGERDDSKRGLDIVLALDVSKSMLVDDVGMTRLAKARALIDALVPSLANDRVGAVVFAGTAAHFPLTDDKAVAAQFLHDVGPADLPGGSELGEAIRVGGCMLRPDTSDPWGGRCASVNGRGHGGDPLPGEEDHGTTPTTTTEELSERSKVLVIFTDGADGAVGGELASQVEAAKQLGITIVPIGLGTITGGPVPDLDERGEPSGFKRNDAGEQITSTLDDDGLRELAGLGGDPGRYLQVGTDPIDPAPVVAVLGALTRGALQRRSGRVMDEWYALFLFPGFMLLVIEACIGTRRRIRYPEG